MDSQRSLAAIVFTDVVGFSALMAADEDRAMRLFAADVAVMREICTRNDGQVLKTMGDGALMVFGSGVQAVASALEMQAAFAGTGLAGEERLVHRIGIHVGDVLLSENDVQGDGVNVAARLHEAAPPGGIWVSSTVYDIVKGRLPVTGVARGNREFKNIPVPVMVFEISKGGEPVKGVPKRGSSKQFGALATAFLGVAILAAGGLVYWASLNPHVREIIERPVTVVSKSGPNEGAGERVGGSSAVGKPGPSRVASPPAEQPVPQTGVSETGKSSASEAHPATEQDGGAGGATSAPERPGTSMPATRGSAGPSPQPPTKPSVPLPSPSTGTSASVDTPPVETTPDLDTDTPASDVGTDVGDGAAGPAKGSVATGSKAGAVNPNVAKLHYFFKNYLIYLKSLPGADTVEGQREIHQWHAIAVLKDQALAYLQNGTNGAQLMVHMDGPDGTADYSVGAIPTPGHPLQPKISIAPASGAPGGGASGGGSTRALPFGRLTPTQADAIFVSAGRAMYAGTASSSPKTLYQRRVYLFEKAYGLPRTSL